RRSRRAGRGSAALRGDVRDRLGRARGGAEGAGREGAAGDGRGRCGAAGELGGRPMTSRSSIACVLLVAAVPGLLLAPVFGLGPLLAPVAAVLITCYAVTELCRIDAVAPWRPVLALVAGLLVLVCVLYGVPTGDSVLNFLVGITNSWQLTL